MYKLLVRYKNKILKYKSLFFILSSLSISSFIIGAYVDEPWKSLLVNLCATFIGTIFTVLIVDEIITRQKESEYAEAYKNAYEELTTLASMMISYIRDSFKIGFDFNLDMSKDLEEQTTRITRQTIKEVPLKLRAKMEAATVDDWKRLVMNIFLIRHKLGQVVPLYKDTIPPNVLGKLLSLKKSFETFDYTFGLLADLFINEPENWPKNNLGHKHNLNIRNTQMANLENNIKDIFNKADLLLKELEKWKKAI